MIFTKSTQLLTLLVNCKLNLVLLAMPSHRVDIISFAQPPSKPYFALPFPFSVAQSVVAASVLALRAGDASLFPLNKLVFPASRLNREKEGGGPTSIRRRPFSSLPSSVSRFAFGWQGR